MARKDLMKGLMDAPETATTPARVDAAKPRYSTGAIGAVSRSIEELKRRSVIEVEPRMIDAGGLKDRLDVDDADLASLTDSIRDYGQQVPVLLRVHPDNPDRYQIVYGRRRVAALQSLGEPVKALIRDLDDEALVLAQGQENAARKDLTFIEKANFARQMRDAGYDRKVICDALAMDKTLISRLLSITERVPVTLIEAIGAAPSIGRDRWMALADKLGNQDMIAVAVGETSDQRFEAVLTALTPPPPDKPLKGEPLKSYSGAVLAKIQTKNGRRVITMTGDADASFDDWLVKSFPKIHREWLKSRGEA